jgi:hypothetical protein
MSTSFRHRLAAAGIGAVLGLGLLAPIASRAATPMENGCRLTAPSTVTCNYIARGNGRWASASSSAWRITILHDRRVRVVANSATAMDADTGMFRAVPGDVVTLRFDDMVSAGMLWAGDA